MDEKKIVEYMMTKKYKEGEYLCWDFVRDVYKDMYDFELPEYPVDEVPAVFKNKLTANFEHIKVNKENAIEGDIIVFSKFCDQHAGVMLDNENFIHLTMTNVGISQLSNLGSNYVIYRPYK